MADFDWNVPAQLWHLEGPPSPDSPRTQVGTGTLRVCIGKVMERPPSARVDLAISTADYPLFRKLDIEMMARRADLGGWLKVD